MAKLHMTIDPSFSHTVVDILNEKMWDGDIPGIHTFMKESFGLENDKLNANIITGKYVMIFNEDGTGNIKPREEVTTNEAALMCGLPKLLTVGDIIQRIKIRTKRIAEDQEFVIKNYVDLFYIHTQHDVSFGSTVLDTKFGKLVDLSEVDADVTATMTTEDLIRIYVDSEGNPYAKGIIDDITEHEGRGSHSAARLLYLMDIVTRAHNEQEKLNRTLQYIKENNLLGNINMERLDNYNMDGTEATTEEIIANLGQHYWFSPYLKYCYEVDETYKFIHSKGEEFKAKASLIMSNVDATKVAVKSMSRDYTSTSRNKSHTNDDLDTFIAKAMEEPKPFGPVKPDENNWDAGWISPEGAFFADKGPTACFLHLNLAKEIAVLYDMKDSNGDGLDNPDHELEKQGWLKFHNQEVAYLGYHPGNIGKQRPISNRQIDKLYEYAKHMGYTSLYCGFTNKHIEVSEMYNYSKEEWADIFEY